MKFLILNRVIPIVTEAHSGQFRLNSPIPYIIHPLEVLRTLLSWGLTDEDVLCAAVGHDVGEDAPSFLSRLGEILTGRAMGFIEDLTTPPTILTQSEKFFYFQKYFGVASESLAIKLADRICNIWDFYRFSNRKYAPIYALRGFYIYKASLARIVEFPPETANLMRKEIDRIAVKFLQPMGINLMGISEEEKVLEKLGFKKPS